MYNQVITECVCVCVCVYVTLNFFYLDLFKYLSALQYSFYWILSELANLIKPTGSSELTINAKVRIILFDVSAVLTHISANKMNLFIV